MNEPARPYGMKSDAEIAADLTYWRGVRQTDAGVEAQNFAAHRCGELETEIKRRARERAHP